jgi:predicted transcriptional regulator of viral defense system
MRSIEILRKNITFEYFNHSEIINLLGQGDSLKSKVKRMLKAGELIQLKRGHYIFGEGYRKGSVDVFHIANLLHGPSYVSLESALSHWSLIPELVHGATSISAKRSTKVNTTIGAFSYRQIPWNSFRFGVIRTERRPNFLIASPEKSILDKVYLDFRGTNVLSYLVEGLRIEVRDLQELNWRKMLVLAKHYNKKSLLVTIKNLKGEI